MDVAAEEGGAGLSAGWKGEGVVSGADGSGGGGYEGLHSAESAERRLQLLLQRGSQEDARQGGCAEGALRLLAGVAEACAGGSSWTEGRREDRSEDPAVGGVHP